MDEDLVNAIMPWIDVMNPSYKSKREAAGLVPPPEPGPPDMSSIPTVIEASKPLFKSLAEMAVYMSPGVGDMLDIADAGREAEAAEKALKLGEYLEAVKHGGLAGLSGLSLIPLLGLGAGPVKKALRGRAIRYFGETDDLREVGYILPAGGKLDLSGRHQGNVLGGERVVDHGELFDVLGVGGHKGMTRFMDEGGAVRWQPESGSAQISAISPPDGAQIDVMLDGLAQGGHDSILLEITAPVTGESVKAIEITNPTKGKIKSAIQSGVAEYHKRRKPPNRSLAARMQRAEDQGFDTGKTWYRGTREGSDNLITEGRGKTAGTGAWFVDTPDVANTYAGGRGGEVLAAYTKKGNDLVVDAGGKNWNDIGTGDAIVELPDGTQENVFDLFGFYPGDTASTDDIARAAREAGYDSVTIENVIDRGGANFVETAETYLRQNYGLEGRFLLGNPKVPDELQNEAIDYASKSAPGAVRAVFNENAARSIHALFENAEVNSSNLTAAVGALGLSHLLASQEGNK